MSEEQENEDVNPFLQRLRDNQLEQARSALIKTICENTDQTIGGVLGALEEDDSGEGIMEDMFRRLTISELVMMAHPYIVGDAVVERDEDVPAAEPSRKKKKKKKKVDPDSELDDDDEFDNDGSGKQDKPKKNKKKGKDKKSKKKDKAPKKEDKSKANGNGKPTKAKVLKYITKHAADEESAVSNEALHKKLGGDGPYMKAILDELLEEEEIERIGKARGTKYHVA